MEPKDDIKVYSPEFIAFVAIVGGIIVFLLFRQIWGDDGLISGYFSGMRILTVLAAAGLGLAIGWMTYPRIPTLDKLFGKSDKS